MFSIKVYRGAGRTDIFPSPMPGDWHGSLVAMPNRGAYIVHANGGTNHTCKPDTCGLARARRFAYGDFTPQDAVERAITAVAQAYGHDGHKVSVEVDMADEERYEFAWCETCSIQVAYVEYNEGI